MKVREKGGNFKTNMFFTEASSFLYCLSSRESDVFVASSARVLALKVRFKLPFLDLSKLINIMYVKCFFAF